MIWRLLRPQGAIGLGLAALLSLLLLVQRHETARFRSDAKAARTALQRSEDAYAQTVRNYREVADAARQADAENVRRVAALQASINEGSEDAFQNRIDDARARAQRVQRAAVAARADPGHGGAAAVPGLSDATGQADRAAAPEGLSVAERLTATEQAIQLDELIRWVNAQMALGRAADDGVGPPAAEVETRQR